MFWILIPLAWVINLCTTIRNRSSHPRVFLGKGVLKICSKFTREHPWWNAILIKMQGKIFKMTLRHECSPLNLLYIFRTSFLKNISGGCFSTKTTLMSYSIIPDLFICIISDLFIKLVIATFLGLIRWVQSKKLQACNIFQKIFVYEKLHPLRFLNWSFLPR